MKKLLVLVLISATTWCFAQQSENRSVGSFKGLKVAEGIDVYLKKGDKEVVRVEVTGTELKNVITEIADNNLRIHMREGRYRDHSVKVYVTYVTLERLSASSAGNVFAEGVLKSKSLTLSASSAGTIDIEIESDEVKANASSAGEIQLKGKSRKISADAGSSGEIYAFDLSTEIAEAEASSGGEVKIKVSSEITARASSGGDIWYRGNPERSDTSSSSGGSVKKSN